LRREGKSEQKEPPWRSERGPGVPKNAVVGKLAGKEGKNSGELNKRKKQTVRGKENLKKRSPSKKKKKAGAGTPINEDAGTQGMGGVCVADAYLFDHHEDGIAVSKTSRLKRSLSQKLKKKKKKIILPEGEHKKTKAD